MAVDRSAVEAVLKSIVDPHLQQDLLTAKVLRSIEVDAGNVSLALSFGYPFATVKDELHEKITAAIRAIPGVNNVTLSLDWKIEANKVQHGMKSMENVKNIIAISSGKGGVGKSTVAANLALALQQEGARVGLLDADIYGPSQAVMMGVPDDTRPEQYQGQFLLPVNAHGLQTMSMAYLVTEKTPMVWRGPMVSGALQQMLTATYWKGLDYLIIDMPPGTGDIQLTLSQKVPVAGSVIVTTPQNIALQDAVKGIEMFRKVDVPVLGIIENMALHVCSNCQHVEHIFGEGGGEAIASEYDVPLLGALPLSRSIRENADSGKPSVVAEPDGVIAQTYRQIARNVAAKLAQRGKNYANIFPNISISND